VSKNINTDDNNFTLKENIIAKAEEKKTKKK